MLKTYYQQLNRGALIFILIAALLFFYELSGHHHQRSTMPAGGERLTGLRLQMLIDKAMQEKESRQVFIDYLLPRIRTENEKLMLVRQWIRNYNHDYFQSEVTAQDWLCDIATAFRFPCHQKPDRQYLKALLERVDVVPEIWVVAKAAEKSDWGKAWHVNRANNLFNQRCCHSGCGISESVSNLSAHAEFYNRDKRYSHSTSLFAAEDVASFNNRTDGDSQLFSSIEESLRNYLLDVNSLPSFQRLREYREKCRRSRSGLNDEAAGLHLVDERSDHVDRSFNASDQNEVTTLLNTPDEMLETSCQLYQR